MDVSKREELIDSLKLPSALECAGRFVWLASVLLDQIVLTNNLNSCEYKRGPH